MEYRFRDEAAELREKLARVERERDEYQSQVHDLTERVNGMTNAASMAAGTAESALRRIMRYEPVVEAAVALVDDYRENVGFMPGRGSLFSRLVKAVIDFKNGAPS
jgi:hypothetical protein